MSVLVQYMIKQICYSPSFVSSTLDPATPSDVGRATLTTPKTALLISDRLWELLGHIEVILHIARVVGEELRSNNSICIGCHDFLRYISNL